METKETCITISEVLVTQFMFSLSIPADGKVIFFLLILLLFLWDIGSFYPNILILNNLFNLNMYNCCGFSILTDFSLFTHVYINSIF